MVFILNPALPHLEQISTQMSFSSLSYFRIGIFPQFLLELSYLNAYWIKFTYQEKKKNVREMENDMTKQEFLCL